MKVELDLSNDLPKSDLKMQPMLIHRNLLKKKLKSDADKLDIDKLKNVPINLRNLESKVDKLGADELVPVSFHLSKLRSVVKIMLFK